ncbi:[FeFe] hydrogenase H-cluster radical SAM maturase HydG [Desulfoluna butyratoxydans]|uniref:[fefe]-hydrogenase maturation hydg radical sam n=1 Tax=Desulfoluna butyratoxydans TaxID=231438 RepID=A0A4U8YNQ8_9BACT|nr:[FeFe] hydrogenase H-cluster radical SAM maturase HydG [Desulfoluna butyratoxydans]VFQ45775.1 [fefe]-hydrogenase maturation hydg radical sam [Desulfoluna butyratoxydans]
MTYDPEHPEDFIDAASIWNHIETASNPAPERVREVLAKAGEMKGLTLEEAAVLLACEDTGLDDEIFATAKRVKESIYGNRMVLFAPLYITNECCNCCSYCGFNATNKELTRRTLTMDEIKDEVRVLEDQGHKRLLLVYGEHPRFGAEWMKETVEAVYATQSEKSGEIRRVNINCAPLSVDGFKTLASAGIGTYQCFQETYHRETYAKVHLKGKKTDYLWRLHAMHRAMEGGIDDVGMGALFGLFDHRFELLALLAHAQQLEADTGVGPHTISFPRIEPALGSEMSTNPPDVITDHRFKKIVAITRLAVPYTGLIMSTRENGELRRELMELGVSQMSAGSRTYPGAYSDPEYDRPDVQQFCLGDNRSLDEVIREMAENGFTPSWCTACYRKGRTGDHFMGLAKQGFIQEFCIPNALLTLREYLSDYASPETRAAGEALLARSEETMAQRKCGKEFSKLLKRVTDGERDLYF